MLYIIKKSTHLISMFHFYFIFTCKRVLVIPVSKTRMVWLVERGTMGSSRDLQTVTPFWSHLYLKLPVTGKEQFSTGYAIRNTRLG